jgi:hypothetical protein
MDMVRQRTPIGAENEDGDTRVGADTLQEPLARQTDPKNLGLLVSVGCNDAPEDTERNWQLSRQSGISCRLDFDI